MPFNYIKFERLTHPVCKVQFGRNPSPADYSRSLRYMQPQDFSDSGDIYIYDKSTGKQYRVLHWRNISAADYAAFIGFVRAVKGSAYNFNFTDADGTLYMARIMNASDIQSRPVVAGRESLTVELLIENILSGSEWDSGWGNVW